MNTDSWITIPRLMLNFRRISLAVSLVALIAVPAAVMSHGDNPSSATSPETAPGITPSEVNVAWLVLDEFPLYSLLRTDGTINDTRFPGFGMLAKTSTWYRDTLGTAQRTTEAVPALLDGKWPTIRNYPVYKDHPVNLFTLTHKARQLDTHQAVTDLCAPGMCAPRVPKDQQSMIYHVQELRAFGDRISSSTTPTVHFSHVILPHRPWILTPELRIARDLKVDPRPSQVVDRRRDAYQGLLRQAVATDKLLLELLTKLKNSPNWERTMLIVTADHAMTFVPGETFRDEVNPNNPVTLDDIYRVPLFIKYPEQSTQEVNDCKVSSIDILPTVLSVTGIKHNADLDGVDLSTECPQRVSRKVQWPYTGADLTTSFTDLIQRVRYYDNWVTADGDVLDIYRVGLSGSLIGMQAPEKTKTADYMSWENIDPDAFKNISDTEFGYSPARVSGRVTTNKPICAKCEGLLVIDNVIVGVMPELAGAMPTKKRTYFTTSLMTSGLTSRSSEAELWIADWSLQEPQFFYVGPSTPAVLTTNSP